MRLPSRDPGGAGQTRATRTAAESMLAGVADLLAAELRDARARTLLLVQDLDDGQWIGPRLPIVNPLLWEVGHLGWFQEFWTLRHARGRPPELPDGDALYDSAKVAHDTRWDLPLLTRPAVLAYLERVLGAALETLGTAPDRAAYFHRLALFHEDMHDEAFTYTRQTLGYPAPAFPTGRPARGGGPLPGDVEVPGGPFLLGATRDEPFVFDNEKRRRGAVAGPAFRGMVAPRHLPAGHPRLLVRGGSVLPLGGTPASQRNGVGARRRHAAQAPVPLGKRSARRCPRQPGWPRGRTGRGRVPSPGRQRLRLPPDDRKRVGVDRERLPALPRVRRGSLQGVFGTLVRDAPQGLARGLLGDPRAPAPQHLAELLSAGSA